MIFGRRNVAPTVCDEQIMFIIRPLIIREKSRQGVTAPGFIGFVISRRLNNHGEIVKDKAHSRSNMRILRGEATKYFAI